MRRMDGHVGATCELPTTNSRAQLKIPNYGGRATQKEHRVTKALDQEQTQSFSIYSIP